jgi:hypothetical protein
VIGGENLSGGFLGTAAVAWLSSLVNREYTATQYALFSSLVTLPGKLIGGRIGLSWWQAWAMRDSSSSPLSPFCRRWRSISGYNPA